MLLVAGATAAAADVLVVRATGPSAKSYPAGKSLADNAKIALKQNDTLVLLDKAGTRTLRGPGTFTPSMSSQAANRVVVASSETTQRRARIGAVRSAGLGTQYGPTLWHLDVSKSSNFCLADPAQLTLWRPDASQPVTLTVTRAKDGTARKIDWPAGAATLAWPSDLAVGDGADYRLSWQAGTSTNVKFRTLPSVPASVDAMASSLIQRGCEGQLDFLIASVPEAAPPSG